MKKITFYFIGLITITILLSCESNPPTSDKQPDSSKLSEIETIEANEDEQPNLATYFSDSINLDGFESCAFGNYENIEEALPISIVDEYELVHLEIDNEFEKVLKDNYHDALIFPIAKNIVGNTSILLYGITYNKDYLYAREYRIIIYQNKKVTQNILFSASISEDGETNLCRKLQIFPNHIELLNQNSENIEYLNIKDIETYSF